MKRIVLLSDGTGNSSSKLFKTNVWRMYQSLDLATVHGGVRQIACYNDGVGTSAFKPIALLGGAFGYGLKRNVLHLYEFLCQNWEGGDEIYIFGFSRGAFTVRILAGLIARMGILVNTDPLTLPTKTRRIYRDFRFARYTIVDTPVIVRAVRSCRIGLTRAWRAISRTEPASLEVACPEIAFLGVWDTVAAYGSPLAELTRGIDRYVFPLSMPDRRLSSKVRVARHALALDDERDTFHPLLWDELEPPETDRLQQVWFAGMHADIGGGYPDDSLSFNALAWMMGEAHAAGLEFLPHAHERFAPPPGRSAMIHDSRKGLAGYYRYQPRRLSAYLLPNDLETEVMRDPAPKARAHVSRIKLHHTAVDRIRNSTDRYAPIVMPAEFDVVDPAGAVAPSGETAAARTARMVGQKGVWDIVWHKRVNYFLMVACSIIFALMPLWGAPAASAACESWVCVISPVIRTVGAFLPAFLQYWIDAVESHPGYTMTFAAVLTGLLLRSAALQRQIQDRMWRLWAPERGGAIPVVSVPTSWVHRVRTSKRYLDAIRWIKWQLLPNVLGVVALCAVIAGVVDLIAIPVLRQEIVDFEADGRVCDLGQRGPSEDFHTNMTCWPLSPIPVLAGHTYRVELTIKEPWLDGTLPSGPEGIHSGRLPYLLGFAGVPFRRTISGRWFQVFVTIVSDGDGRHVQPLDFQNEGDHYVARFVPSKSGTVLLWVNDAVVGPHGFSSVYYDNNHGSASVGIIEQTTGPAK